MHISVIGNTASNAGLTTACDLALAGHNVCFSLWGGEQADLDVLRNGDDIRVAGDPNQLTSRRLGTASFRLAASPIDAVGDAELVILDLLPREIEAKVGEIAAALKAGQVLHINTHSYWSALRAARVLKQRERDGVVVTEIIAPTIAGRYDRGVLTTDCLRLKLQVAAFPASQSEYALNKVRVFYPDLVAAKNVLETGFANMNFLLHPSVALLNIGWLDRCGENEEAIDFWGTGATANTELLAGVQDQERSAVCRAFDVPFQPMVRYVKDTYSGGGEGLKDALRSCPFYRSRLPRPPDVWRQWLGTDLPQAHLPFLEFAKLAGLDTPIHQAYVAVLGALLGSETLKPKITLSDLGLTGLSVAEVIAFVEAGHR